MLKIDYRKSHTAPGKGMSYEKSFNEHSYRKYVSSWEKKILEILVSNCFQGDLKIRYLDFACGTGRIIGYMEDLVDTSIGVDISDSMLQVGRQNVKRSELIKADLTQENILAGEMFDLITAFRFFLNAQPELREDVICILASLLSDEGRLVFNIHMNQGSIADRALKLARQLKASRKGKYNSLGRNEVSRLVQKAGLQIVDTYHFGLLPVVNEKWKIPGGLVNFIEENGSRISRLESASRYVIYVCKKDTGSPQLPVQIACNSGL